MVPMATVESVKIFRGRGGLKTLTPLIFKKTTLPLALLVAGLKTYYCRSVVSSDDRWSRVYNYFPPGLAGGWGTTNCL